ncbi:peptidylprolyl isomerase [Aliisedimentitalea scapharcae]|uniref:Parvulin-like PPIase n=1 Tax=Aliisedimentitalea scapharcae TaxID=1524259 RepID=A0ABZ2XQX9_9RHOB
MQTFLTPKHLTRIAQHSLASLVIAAGLALPVPAIAGGLFSPAISVNESVISQYELEQRALLMELLRAPGDPVETARKELIDDRLRQEVLDDVGLVVSDESIQQGIVDFAARTGLKPDEFIKILGENGVSPETFRDFVKIGLGWREYIADRYLSRARPSEAEIDRAMGQSGGSSVQILLSELIMPVTEQNITQVEAIAADAQQTTSYEEFSSLASQFSAASSRDQGGRLGWLSLDQLPPALRPTLLSLQPGDVTNPMRLDNALALFQLRGVREANISAPRYAAIEYATYRIAGGRTPEALAAAKSVADRVDTCDDLYGVAKGQPPELLDRQSLSPSDIPSDIAVELAKLDQGEISTVLTRNNGQTLLLLMMCGRTAELAQDASRAQIADGLTQQRLAAFSTSLLDQLRADAVILDK